MSIAANGCNEKKHSSQHRFRCPLYSVHKVSSHLYLEKVDGQQMNKQTKVERLCLRCGGRPAALRDQLVSLISEQCAEMGHGTAENRPRRMWVCVWVCVNIEGMVGLSIRLWKWLNMCLCNFPSLYTNISLNTQCFSPDLTLCDLEALTSWTLPSH